VIQTHIEPESYVIARSAWISIGIRGWVGDAATIASDPKQSVAYRETTCLSFELEPMRLRAGFRSTESLSLRTTTRLPIAGIGRTKVDGRRRYG
jgi:hypothetical protein